MATAGSAREAALLLLCAHALLALPRAGSEPSPGPAAGAGSSSLAFVFDVTGSMYDDLQQVVEGASRILEKSLRRRTRPIRNFVLVPFHDPDVGPVSITTDPEQFQRDLRELFVQGGGDCPEMSVGAIKKALEVSLPGSFIYVFTDARAKDHRLKQDVLRLVQLRQSQVVFVLTGDCGDRSQPGYRVYEEIAATSSGQIFHLDKQQVNEVLKWVEETVQSMKVHLLSTDHEGGEENRWPVPFDPSLREVTVSLSGPAPEIELRDPYGRIVGEELGLTELLNIPNSARVVGVKHPRPGTWTLRVSCSGRHSLRVTGVSNLDFRAGFSSRPVTDFSQTRERPVEGVPAHALLKSSGLSPPGRVNQVDLLSVSGRPLRTLPVPTPSDGGSGGLWNVPEFRTPPESFFLRITGKDEGGYRFQRMSTVSYTNIIPEPPAVSMPDRVHGYYKQPAVIGCSVESHVPYRVQFSRGGARLGAEQAFQVSANATWEIPRVLGTDEGTYECVAYSSAGMGRAQTHLAVREPPPALKPPLNVTAPPGEVAVLSCWVEGPVSYNLTWYFAGKELAGGAGRVRTLGNSSLEISPATPQDAGEYHCVASNRHGQSRAAVWLLVPEPPRTVISPQALAFSRGAEVRLSCAASGSPPAQISWRRGDVLLPGGHRVSVSPHGTLTIREAVPEDAGSYTCLASNEAGSDTQTVTLSYTEPPGISVVNPAVLVAAGEEAILECQPTGVPPPLVTWYKGDRQVGTLPSAQQDARRGTLRIGQVQETDAGEYSCVASSPAGTSTAVVTLGVGTAPEFSETPRDATVDVGENVTLPCAARGFPDPVVTWRRQDRQPLYAGADGHRGLQQLGSGALSIEGAWLDDEGLYICEAQNQFGLIWTEARVTVTGLEPPLLAQGDLLLSVVVGHSLTLPCMLLDGIPLPSRHWAHNGEPVTLSSRRFLRSDGSLHIENAGVEDAGIYVCTAVNVAGSANISITIEIHSPPVISPGPAHYVTDEGVAITLPCDSTGVPKPAITWSKENEPLVQLRSSDPASEGQLLIPKPTVEDSGVYICTAANPVGYASRELRLSVNTKPRILSGSGQQEPIRMVAGVGSEVTLPCEVEGSPAPLVTWNRDAHPIPPITARFTVSASGSLQIRDARLTDSKLYTCFASNSAGNASLTYSLHVQAPPRIKPALPPLLKAAVGQSVTLPCAAQGEPSPAVSWSWNGEPLRDRGSLEGPGGSLSLRGVNHSDGGVYRCVAANSAGQDAAETLLEILEAPLFEEAGDVFVQEAAGKKVVVPCRAQGTPTPAVRWLKNGLEFHGGQPGGASVSEEGSLVIASASASHSGDYKCVASNEVGTAERRVQLRINVPPEIHEDGQPLNRTVALLQPLSLGCDAFGVPQPTISWTKDGRPVSELAGVWLQNEGRSLRILRAQAAHSGLFSCAAANAAGEARRDVHVAVHAPPVISGSSGVQDLAVAVGQEVELQCRVDGSPAPLVEWSRDGEVLSREGDPHVQFSDRGQLVRVKSVRLRDQGLYQCLATNSAGRQSRQFRLVVQAPPSFGGFGETTEVSVVLGHAAVLSCEPEAVPSPSLTWLKDGRPILAGARLSSSRGGRELHLGAARADDAGLYTCRASNPAGTALRHYRLTVLVPPQIEGDDAASVRFGAREAKVHVNKTLVLSCQSRGVPEPTVQWYKNGQLLKNDSHVEIGERGRVLWIQKALLSHEGQYTCVASSEAGEDRKDVHVSVQVPPVFQRSHGRPSAWELGERGGEEEEEEVEEEGEAEGMTERREVVANSPVTLSCESNAIPPPLLTWYHEGKKLSTSARVTVLPGGHALQIPRARVEDAGKYTCQAVNEAGEDRMHYELEVLVPPVILGQAGDFVDEVGMVVNSTAQLRCEASGTPTPAISWLKDGAPLYGGARHRILEDGKLLQIDMVQSSDMAGYLCVAENKVGSAEKLFSLTVQVPPRIVGANPEHISVIEGHMVSLLCDVQAYPSPEISWARDGKTLHFGTGLQILPGSQVLQLPRAQLADAGLYVCTATNPAGQGEKHLLLSVYAPPTLKPHPDPDKEIVTPRAGGSVTLHCDAQGVPEPEVTWYRNGLQLAPDHGLKMDRHRLEIQGVQVADSGLYTCKVSNIAGQVDRTFRLTVHVPPVLDQPLQQTVTRTLGTHLTLLCEATGVPAPSITWLKDGTPIESSIQWRWAAGGSRLELGPLQLSHTGTYTCLARNSEGETRKDYRVTVQVPPSILGSGRPTELSVPVGEELTLECLAVGTPKPDLKWLKDGAPLDLADTEHLQASPDGASLRLLGLRAADSGTYSCLAESPAGRESRIYTLTVTVPPAIAGSSAEPRAVTAAQDGVVTLQCQAAGTPPPRLTWLRNGRPLSLSPRTRLLSSDTALRISPVHLSDSGVYTCVARSPAGQAELSYDVQVQVPPGVDRSEPSEQVTVVKGSAVTFTCEARGVPPPSLSWFKDGQPLSLHRNLLSDGQETRLRLPAVTPHDAGHYSCVASNQAGSSTKTFNLTVLEPPKILASGSPEEVSVAVHSPLELECAAEGVPPPTLSWLRDGRPLLGAAVTQRQGQLLRIGRIQVEDAGLYTCLASSPAGEDGRNHWIRVQVPPTLLGSADSRTVTAVAKGHLTLECRSDSEPPPAIQWHKDGAKLQLGGRVQSLAGGQFLEIQEVGAQDSGQYSCVATNVAGSSRLEFTVEVQVPPGIQAGPSLVTAHAGQGAVLPCVAEGLPAPTVTWRKDGAPLVQEHARLEVLPEGSLRIAEAGVSDAGRYLCTASNPAGSERRGIDLRVHVGPSISPGPPNVTVTEGVRASLSCEASGTPPPRVTWKRNGSPIDLSRQPGAYRLLSSGSLVITSPASQDEGYFECTAANEAGEERRLVEVTLQVPPSIEDDVTVVTATTMSPVILPCHVTGRPEPEVSWTKSGARLGSRGGSYRILPTGVLEITAVTPSHAGRYTCSARNAAGVAYKHITLTVHEPPEVQPMAESVQVVLNHGIVLPCEVHGYPRPTVTWQREGVPIVTGPRLAVLPNGALQLSRVTLGDAGTYQCLAQNDAGTSVGRTRLVLQVPPVLSAPALEYTVVLSQPVSLLCAADGQPQPEVAWLREGRPLLDGARHRAFANGTLRIEPTQRGDAGRYTCAASNPAGSSSLDLRLLVHAPPVIPAGKPEASVIQGFQALLPCAAQGVPEPAVSWEKDGAVVPDLPGKFTVLRSGELIVEQAEPGDAGTYTCVAVNAAGTARRHARLSVNVRPVLKELPGDVTLNKGQRLVLSCHAQGAPTPTISWTVNNKPLPGPSSVDGRSSVVIESAAGGDSGTYVCVAENRAGAVRALAFVRVREPPVLDGTSHSSQTEPLGGNALLDCVARGDPAPTLRWHREGQPLSGTLRVHQLHNGSLAIYGVASGDAGEYRCAAESEAGAAERTVLLRVQVPGGFSTWLEWGPCSVTCGRGVQERIRLCNNPAPANGGRQCEGRSLDSRSCQAKLCPGAVPQRARGSLIGMVNDREFGVAYLDANVTARPEDSGSRLQARVGNLPGAVGPLLRVLVSVFAPIYWTTVLQAGESRNGFALTRGVFRQESQVEFKTGEVLRLTHVARGLDAEGVLLVDIVINGFVPRALAGAQLTLQGFRESYVQTGPGQLYAWSSQRPLVNGAPVSLRCNHSVIYEAGGDRQGPLLQVLRVSTVTGVYSHHTEAMDFHLTASLEPPGGDGERCPEGFVLDSDSFCADEDECAAQTPCSHSCHNTMGAYSCSCPPGFSISPDASTCQDVDECQESSVSPCQHRCLNTLGSFRCACRPGYQLSGQRCLDINECVMSSGVCPPHQQCRNTEGGYHCLDSCPPGMTTAGSGVCTDVDECKDGTHMCRYSQTCQNTIGGYLCVCPRGYRSQGVGRPCLDVDECQQAPSPCAHQCRNVAGSFRCLCPPGTSLLGDGRSCAGLERRPAAPNATGVLARLVPQLVSHVGRPVLARLSTQPGGCPPGFSSRDGNCVDVDECAQRRPCQHECRNTPGSFQCLCPPGFQLLPNGRNCKDIDECAEQGIQCGPQQMCFNTRGGYQCLDTPCPASYQRGVSPGTCFKPCSLDCGAGSPLALLQYKLLTLPLGIPANHNVIRLSAFSEAGVLQERTAFVLLEQDAEGGGQVFGIRDEAGRGIIYTLRALDRAGLARLRVQATTRSPEGQVKYQSIFIIYIAISSYPY
ncbi:hemicentin-1 isoform X2 [Lepisosteus oculatus]|uniref:hemicentin-1 isoform X2 n=1 Tax=Lepisosteus oculatus TaxID=7918 RepID=UPI003710BA31